MSGNRFPVEEKIDKWTEELWCPSCKMAGLANLSQRADETAPTVISVIGFRVQNGGFVPMFYCKDCDVLAEP